MARRPDGGKQRAERAAVEAALPDAEAVGGIVEQPGRHVAGRVERRTAVDPVEQRRGEDQRRDREAELRNGERRRDGQRPPGAGYGAAEGAGGGDGPAPGEPYGQPPGGTPPGRCHVRALLAVIGMGVNLSRAAPQHAVAVVLLAAIGRRGGNSGGLEGKRPALAGDLRQAAGKQGRRGGGDGGGGDRAAGERRRPRADGPPGGVERADRTGVQLLKRGSGRAVVGAAGEPGAEPDPVIVAHDRGRLVPDPPSRGRHPPHEVDVLPDEHAVGEPRPRGRLADDEGRAWNIGDPRTGPDDGRPRPHVKRGAGALVAGQPAGPRLMRHDPGRDRADGGIGEVRQQPVKPPRPRNAVRVEKRHEFGRCRRKTGVPRGPGPAVHRPADHPRPVLRGDRLDRGWVGGCVIHDDHAGGHASRDSARNPREAPGEFRVPVPHRDHNRDITQPTAPIQLSRIKPGTDSGKVGMSDPGIEQPTCEVPRGHAVRDRRASKPRRDLARPGRRQPEHPDRRTAHEHRPVRDQPRP